MTDEQKKLKNIVEAALLVAQEPLSVDRLVALFPKDARPERAAIRELIEQLVTDYEGRGIELKRIDTGYRFQSRDEYLPWLKHLWEGRPPRYSRAMLETLAIIAYRQPVTRGEIEEIRGVSVSSDIVRTLMERGWVREVGFRDVPGRPALLGTAREFLEHFNLKSLSELPSLADIRDPGDIAADLNLSLNFDQADAAEASTEDEQAATEGDAAAVAADPAAPAETAMDEASTTAADADAEADTDAVSEADTDEVSSASADEPNEHEKVEVAAVSHE